MIQNEAATRLIRAALDAVDPVKAVHRAIDRHGNQLQIKSPGQELRQVYDLERYDRVYVVGGGKAGAPMAQALTEILGDRITAGWVNVKYGYLTDASLPPDLVLHQAGHPIPDAAGQTGAGQVLELAHAAGKRDLVFCLISGGGSALLPLPVEGISLEDLQTLTNAMLRCGATINEINAVRKHCSQLKGGQLARAASPADVVALMLSDVVGNPLDVIASGPTVPDSTTFADAQSVLAKYGIADKVPTSIADHLRWGVEGRVPETPKPGDPVFDQVQNVIVGSNAIAAQAAQAQAETMGLETLILSTYVEGEAREVAKVMAAVAKSLLVERWPCSAPACVIAGGETTVTLRGDGKGGRNQELALAAAIALDGWEGTTIVALATDGTDGPTDAAGAVVDGTTLDRARALGMSAEDYLARNDSYTFFERLGDLIQTGPTNTNVNDLTFILAK